MTSCLVIAAVISCTGLPANQTPAAAVQVLTASVQPYVAPWSRALRVAEDVRAPRTNPYSPFRTPATPIKPLADPWRVTTRVTAWGVDTWFNGRLMR
jgi:hypothetical protein